MSSRLDPFSVPIEVREFLYNSILLPWESKTVQFRSENINKLKMFEAIGVRVEYFDTLDDLAVKERAVPNELDRAQQYLYFYNVTNPEFSAGYPCLFKRLRDTTAHAHFEAHAGDLIFFHHTYPPNKDSAKTRVVGRLSLSTLSMLVAFMTDCTPAPAKSLMAAVKSVRKARK